MTELGNKHECLGCSTKFYDLGKNELICPSCGENQKNLADTLDSSPRTRKTKKKKKAAKSSKKTSKAAK